MKQETTQVLIIGAGPSGCVAAAYLHQQGIAVKVVEKNTFPRFVIGESLLPRCMDHFEEVGLLDCLQARGYEIKRGARFLQGEVVSHFDFSKKFTEGYDWTWQVPRDDFDHTLAKEIMRRGIDLSFGTTVTDVRFEGSRSSTTIATADNTQQVVHADFIIDASGYGRVLARQLGLEKPSPMPKNSSVFTHVTDSRRPPGEEGTLITFDVVRPDVWIWVIPFSNGITSIGVVGPTEFIESYQGSTTEALADMMRLSDHYYDRFAGLDYLFPPYKVKNFAKAVTRLYGSGFALTGNSAEFLDPVFSSGVTFATETGLLAAKLATRQLKGESVNWEEEYTGYLKKGVGVFGTYVKEWYTGNLQKLFFHRPENPDIKRKICAVLAGYAWDDTNPFVKKHNRIIRSLAHVIDMGNAEQTLSTNS